MKKNKVFITGAAGFLGSHLAEKLSSMGDEVVGVDNMMGGYADNVSAKCDPKKPATPVINILYFELIKCLYFFSNLNQISLV